MAEIVKGNLRRGTAEPGTKKPENFKSDASKGAS